MTTELTTVTPALPRTDDRCSTCNRDAHRPYTRHGNHGHPYTAPVTMFDELTDDERRELLNALIGRFGSNRMAKLLVPASLDGGAGRVLYDEYNAIGQEIADLHSEVYGAQMASDSRAAHRWMAANS
jgi:hypothetical protein